MKKIVLLLSIIILLSSCCVKNTENCHKKIKFVNKTNKTIYVDNSSGYPETDFTKLIGNPLESGFSKILAHESDQDKSSQTVLPSFNSCYENIYKNSIPSGIMLVFVFDRPNLETKGWDYIKENELVLKRYELTLKDLDSLDWTITYDGE